MDDDGGPDDRGGDEGTDDAPDQHTADVWVAGVRLGPDALAEVDGLRQTIAPLGAVQADQLRRVARLAERCAADARAALADGPRVPGAPTEDELVHTVVTHELMVVLGIGKRAAERLHDLAQRLIRVLPETLTALETGRLDLARATVLVEETRLLDPVAARAVQTTVLTTPEGTEPPAGPWEGPSPRAWRALVQRTVVKVDADAARRRREQALADRLVRAWATGDGTGVLQIVADQVDVAMADRVITDLALTLPSVAPDGSPLLSQAPAEGWTRQALVDAAREALPDPPPLVTDGYEPTVPISEHVRTVHPRCTSYDCARTAVRCDLDHDEPWPRGPTAAWNLAPRCRRHHEMKTRCLVRTTLHRDGSLSTRTLLGLMVMTRPPPLPGTELGEMPVPTQP